MESVMSEFKHLFEPITVGPVTIRNRVYETPHGTYMSDRIPGEFGFGLPSKAQAAYYAERAKGGIGLIIEEPVVIHRSGEVPSPVICGADPRTVPGFRNITDSVHRFGAKIFIQLVHHGHHGNPVYTFQPALAPSQVQAVGAYTIPKEMEKEEIEELVEGFGVTAKNMKDAGYDGVEIHSTHGYLVEQFLSPFYNHRTDEYGGSLENRMRFLLEAIDRIRSYVGRDIAVGVRLNSDEMLAGGLSQEDFQEIAKRLDALQRGRSAARRKQPMINGCPG